MFINYIKTACRSLLRSKGYGIINITGLAIGMAGALLILLWVKHELSYEKFFKEPGQISQIWLHAPADGKIASFNYTPEPLAAALKKAFPEITQATRYMPNGQMLFTKDEKHFNQIAAFVDSSFFKVFDFPLAAGSTGTFFTNPNSVILTEKVATSLFGSRDPLNQVIQLDKDHLVRITAVLKDLPANTDFHFDVLLPWNFARHTGTANDTWESFEAHTFVKTAKNADLQKLDKKIKHFLYSYKKDAAIDISMMPLTQRHLQSDFENGKAAGGRILLVQLFSTIAFFILLIACINFMNLSTAQSEKRAKEVGIRKLTGAKREMLIAQFMMESAIFAFISGCIALLLVASALPYFNNFTGQHAELPYTSFTFWMSFAGFIALTGILAGSYPAFFLSSFKPASVLKGTFNITGPALSPRKVLIVIQFSFAIALIISTLVVRRQISFAQDRSAGYNKEQLIYHALNGAISSNYELIRQELISSGAAVETSRNMSPVTAMASMGNGFTWQDRNGSGTSSIMFYEFSSDAGLLKTMGLKLLEGRDIDIRKYPADSNAMLVNEAALKAMNIQNPQGKWIKHGTTEWKIVGVIENFIFDSPYNKIGPMLISGPAYPLQTIHIKMNKLMPLKRALNTTEKIFKKYNPGYPFEYHFADEQYAAKFENEQHTAILTTIFSGLTILISCLGLFGLTACIAEQRRKEIGVRKVLGASVSAITALLTRDFIKLVGIAFLIACPAAWFLMDKWQQNFDYRVGTEWHIFIFTGMLAVFIAICTVSFQSVKAALANPVKSLRSE